MTSTTKRGLAVAGGAAVALGAFFLLLNRPAINEIPLVGDVIAKPKCPLTGVTPKDESLVDRPAVAIKIENNPAAYPLSGLEKAEVVYEEQVEGGLTRFLAVYHCTDADKAGSVRSARIVDPAIISPVTLIMANAGGNPEVKDALAENDIVSIDENTPGDALSRFERPGYSFEHTLYADTGRVRRIGSKRFDDPPPDDLFRFGELDGKWKKARVVTLNFGSANPISYEWRRGRWFRFDNGQPLTTEAGTQIAVDNVLIEEHEINLSDTLADVLGVKSPEIEDVTGSGRAVLFRDGRVIPGRWRRESEEDAVRFETKGGDEMVFHPGTTWIELIPNDKGDVKGSFSYER